MLNDNDDTAPVALLADVLASVSVNANLIMADERGIHWHAIQRSGQADQGRYPSAARMATATSISARSR